MDTVQWCLLWLPAWVLSTTRGGTKFGRGGRLIILYAGKTLHRAFMQIGIGAFPSKMKVTLILCVFSGSDVGSKWRLLYSLLHPTTKHLNRLIWDILVFPCTGVDTMADWWQLTQGGSKVRRSCQSTILEAACAELHHSDRNLRTAWFEKGDFKIGI